MSLEDEIKDARQTVVTDGYDMSIGEVINLYKNEELVIAPAFQRLFRWDDERKTRFIESIILGIPFPPIFVHQDDEGIWELIDGLQRVSTILQLTGDLKGERADQLGPLVLNGTRFLPSLTGKRWTESAEGAGDGIGVPTQLAVKRSRVRVEILQAGSSQTAKYELFQRLNTGGADLSPQEVRNSIAVSINKEFFDWLVKLSNYAAFVTTTRQTAAALESQAGVEMVLRFVAFRNIPYQSGMDVHEYLDDALLNLASKVDFDRGAEEAIFNKTFDFLNTALDGKAFQRWDGQNFSGKFLMSIFEVLAIGLSKNLAAYEAMGDPNRSQAIEAKAKSLNGVPVFIENSGAGVRGTTRLSKLLPVAEALIKP
ncbi:hypothetical protein ASE85_01710 [Sphingobium sp. Leaf26]|uniref:DUF262 domain-containing protein n=1 Tax=Sphingobium sp. Leaf26 TaxID=1735693 RepID=UPI0006FB7FAE|nr:DUF262 domain-containing protein [Sphingobium sp. Leaf26]KQN09692.1 hypothetical protein ASE85_01710 [Sphingobium sp. Leaf26]